MRILLDIHIFLWFIAGDARLPKVLPAQIIDPQNEVFLSTASVWECIVKHQLGKLPLPQPPEIICQNNGVDIAFRHFQLTKIRYRFCHNYHLYIVIHSTGF